VLDQPAPDDGALADEDVQDALGQPRLERQVSQPQCRERCQLCRLQHDRVAARERRRDLPRRDVEREVPGHDRGDDAERLPEGHVDAARDRDRLAVVLVDRSGVEVEDLRHHRHLAAGARDRLADVPRLDARELLGVLLDERRQAAQEARAVGRRDRAPGREGRMRAGNGRVRLLYPGLLELGERFLGGGVQDGQHAVILDERVSQA
jgi:ParB family chromosome partitioning protein